MKQISLALVIALLVGVTSCRKVTGEGPVKTETRATGNFTGVELRMSGNVVFTQSATTKVEVSAQQNILDVIEAYVSGSKLVLKYKNDVKVKSHEPVTINVSTPAVSSLRISGSGNINAAGDITATDLDLDISGSGNIDLAKVTAGSVTGNISGSGNIKLRNGSANEEHFKISGSGDIDAGSVVAKKVFTITSGSGQTKVNATEKLEATISGSGSVYYLGSPAITLNVSGSGKVKSL